MDTQVNAGFQEQLLEVLGDLRNLLNQSEDVEELETEVESSHDSLPDAPSNLWEILFQQYADLQSLGKVGALKHLLQQAEEGNLVLDPEVLVDLVNETDLVGLLGEEEGGKLTDQFEEVLSKLLAANLTNE